MIGGGEKSKCGNGGILFHCLACRFDGMLLNHYQQSIFATRTSTARIDDNDWKWLEGTGEETLNGLHFIYSEDAEPTYVYSLCDPSSVSVSRGNTSCCRKGLRNVKWSKCGGGEGGNFYAKSIFSITHCVVIICRSIHSGYRKKYEDMDMPGSKGLIQVQGGGEW